MRSLVVGQDFPWPVRLGSHLRLAEVVAALAPEGEVDLFTLVPARRREPCAVPDGVTLARLHTARTAPPPGALRRRAAWATTRLPFEVAEALPCPARTVFESWVQPDYDFVWVSKAATFHLLGRPRLGPTVVDLDDLEGAKIRARVALLDATPGRRGHTPPPADLVRRVRAELASRQALVNAARWDRFERSVAADVAGVLLCSEVDATRSGLAHVTVLPNVYPDPDPHPDLDPHPPDGPGPGGDSEAGAPSGTPTMLFAGNFCYGPNAEGARWFVSEVLPLVREAVPDAVLHLVGEADTSVAALADPPAVVVTGAVPSMAPYLRAATEVVVPIRYGSGTRIKILEAFAFGVPVVSTTLGAEGLSVEDGRHALLADDAAAFAAACLRLLEPAGPRRALVAAAADLYRTRFRPEAARRIIRELARTVTDRPDQADGPGAPPAPAG